MTISKFAIIDKTSNSEYIFVGAKDELYEFAYEAVLYETEKEAQQTIEEMKWDWAGVKEVTPEMI